jgi:hypothetical protein
MDVAKESRTQNPSVSGRHEGLKWFIEAAAVSGKSFRGSTCLATHGHFSSAGHTDGQRHAFLSHLVVRT